MIEQAWYDTLCSQIQPFVCQFPKDGFNAAGYTEDAAADAGLAAKDETADDKKDEKKSDEPAVVSGGGPSKIDPDISYIYHDHKVVQSKAELICKSEGGKLPSSHSQEENDLILAAAQGKAIWLGLSDIASEGNFVWSDGTTLDYENWRKKEPNNKGNRGEHCVEISKKRDGAWNDKDCDQKRRIVCQIHGDPQEAADKTLGEIFPGLNTDLYSFHHDKRRQEDAATDCATHNGFLASILTEQESQFVDLHFNGDEYWIGSNDLE